MVTLGVIAYVPLRRLEREWEGEAPAEPGSLSVVVPPGQAERKRVAIIWPKLSELWRIRRRESMMKLAIAAGLAIV